METIDDADEGVVGEGERFVVAGIGDDDVGVGSFGGCGNEAVAEVIESDVVFGLEGFGFVFDADDGLVLADRYVGVGHTGLGHHQDDGGTLGSSEGAVDAEAFNVVIGVADACCVDESEGDAAQLDGVFDSIAGGTLNVADNGTFLTDKGIEEGRFADVWSTYDGDGNAVLEGITSVEGVGKMGDARIYLLSEFQQFGAVSKFEVFVVGEIKF